MTDMAMCERRSIIMGLIRRDICLLLCSWKRILAYCSSVLVLDLLLVLYSKTAAFRSGIIGITAAEFLSSPERMPLQWFWAQIGIVLVMADFIKKDFCEHTSCFLPHIRKRELYWYSKMLCGMILALVLSVYFVAEKAAAGGLFAAAGSAAEVSWLVLAKWFWFTFGGICVLCWMYFYISLAGNEICGIVVSFAYVLLGLPVKAPFLYCNIYMYSRSGLFRALVMTVFVFVLASVLGKMKINRMDIIGR